MEEFWTNKDNGIDIGIYFDEIEPEEQSNYIVIGALFIPLNKKQEVLSNLLNKRCLHTDNATWHKDPNCCPLYPKYCKELWHQLNDTEIHFTKIHKNSAPSKKTISINWLEYFKESNYSYFNVLFIDLDKLNLNDFGDEKQRTNVYNKFFRTAINYGLKKFFSEHSKVNVKEIYYDRKDDLERHYFFNLTNINKLNLDLGNSKYKVDCKVEFINSNHKKEDGLDNESHLIQFVDLLLGTIRHNLFYISNDLFKTTIASTMTYVLKKLRDSPKTNKNLNISLFPINSKITGKDLYSNSIEFYKNEFGDISNLPFNIPHKTTTLKSFFN